MRGLLEHLMPMGTCDDGQTGDEQEESADEETAAIGERDGDERQHV